MFKKSYSFKTNTASRIKLFLVRFISMSMPIHRQSPIQGLTWPMLFNFSEQIRTGAFKMAYL